LIYAKVLTINCDTAPATDVVVDWYVTEGVD